MSQHSFFNLCLRSRWHFLLAAFLAFAFAPAISEAATRWALVVGNDNYQSVEKLKNARNDARLLAQTLREAKFDVREVGDLDRRSFWQEIEALQSRIKKGDEVVFFFAGHGVQVGAEPVLLPTDIVADTEQQVMREGVPLTRVQDAFRDARLALLVIDACRDNPFPPRGGTRNIGGLRGLAPIDVAEGMAVIMSAGRGQKALDTVPEQTNNNGLFTYEFVRTIRIPGVDVRTALVEVRERVEQRAKRINHLQRPALNDETSGKFYFFQPTSLPLNTAATENSVPVSPSIVRVQSGDEIEQEFWNTIRESKDVRDFQDYAKRYPSGRFIASAERQIRLLSPAASGPAVVVANPSVSRPMPITATLSAAPPQPPQRPIPSPASVSNATVEPKEMLVGTTRFRGTFLPDGPERKLTGQGEVLWANGDKYIGRMERGVRVGSGETQWANGQRYVGQWSQDVPNGLGTITFANSDVYIGHVSAGKPDGQGKTLFASGDRYEGQWLAGRAHGQGVYEWKNGQRYEGPWDNDQPTGRGKLKFSNGDVYEGQIVRGVPAGQGSIRYASSDLYDGQFAEGRPHGDGVYQWKNGDKYTGQWRNGLKHGQGVHAWANGDRWAGEFAEDRQTQNGQLTRRN